MEDFELYFLFLLTLKIDLFYEETVFEHNLQSMPSTNLKLSDILNKMNPGIVSHETALSYLFFFHKML